MRIRTIILSCLIGAVILSVGHEYSRAGSETDTPCLKIGIVSVWKIFQDSKRIAKYRQEALLEQEKMRAKLEQLSREIEAKKAGLKTLKIGSSDYLEQRREILEKQANIEAQQEFYKEHIASREQRVTRELYRDILRETSEVAKQKGLHLVLEKSDPELETLNPTQLEFAMGMHKLLYSEGCPDITEEVKARIDKEE
jgi:Skp family chaperone for outer membrane proteins